jgi:predicted ATP-grasp superfamily ATP-dependent carboligase
VSAGLLDRARAAPAAPMLDGRPRTVLVTDGEQRAALAIVRSLGRAGHRVFVCSARGRSLAGASRHCAGEAAVPDALADPDGFADAVAALGRRCGAQVLLPVAEPALLALLPRRATLGMHLPFAPEDRFRAVCDKAAVAREAVRLGISVPAQRVLADADEARAASGDPGLRFPLVVKPARSVSGEDGARVRAPAMHVDAPAALASALAGYPPAAFPLLLQERVVGPGVGIFVLMREGRVAASFAHRRLREKPPSGGVSVYRESVPMDRALLQRSAQLLGAFGWEGVAMVEYKRDAASGTPYLMEINGRFWGSLQLAIDAGMDFPALLLGAPGRGRARYRAGVRSRWEWGEVDHLLARLRRSPAELALPPGSPGRARAVADFAAAALSPSSRGEVLRLSDPRPFLRETLDWLRRR